MTFRSCLIGFSLLFLALWGVLLPTRLVEPSSVTFQSDAREYSNGAKNILEKGMYSLDGEKPTIEREPGYSLFLAGIYTVFGTENRIAMYAAQGLLYLLASLAFFSEFRKRTSDRVALVAFGFLVTLPAAIHSIFWPLREVVALSLFLLFSASLLHFARTHSWRSAVAAGTLLGLAILTYMSYLFFPLFLLPLLFMWKLPWKPFALMLAITIGIIFLWGIRNVTQQGHFVLSGTHRPAAAWHARGEQAEHLHGLEPIRCLVAEYITRDWTGRSPACSFNALMHAKWPDGIFDPAEDFVIGRSGQAKILRHFPNYLWQSAIEVIELHIPYVNGWGFVYNVFSVVSSVILYLGILFGLSVTLREWKKHLLLILFMAYTIAVFALTDATPRYLVPVIFCYVSFASIGYTRLLQKIHGSGLHHHPGV